MLNRKKITAWILSLAFSFGMSASLPQQVSAKHVKGDVYISVKKDKYRRNQEESLARRMAAAVTGLVIFVIGAIVFVAEEPKSSSTRCTTTTYTPYGSYTTTRTTHSSGGSGSNAGAFIAGMGAGLVAGSSTQ